MPLSFFCKAAPGWGVVLAAGLSISSSATANVTIDWVTVGNAGNAADAATGLGSVGYAYRIGATEVTNAQYAEFLNAVARSDPNGLYNTNMGTNARGGIIRSGSRGSYTYSVKPNMADKPVNYTSWYDAARFANWMSNGQGLVSTEDGVYTFTGPFTVTAINRDLSNPDQVFLPSENEWYKAAYHQPGALGGDGDDYWLYATRSNIGPVRATATSVGDIANPGQDVANWGSLTVWNGQQGNVTTVGSAESSSFYGAFDMNGNVREWNEALANFSAGLRGGSFLDNIFSLQATDTVTFFSPEFEASTVGFRVASPVPAPASAAILALLGLAAPRRRR